MQGASELVTNLVTERDKTRDNVTDLRNGESCNGDPWKWAWYSQSSRANQLMIILSQSWGTFFSLSWELMTTFSIGNVHRFGRFERGKHGPIDARLLYHQDPQCAQNLAMGSSTTCIWSPLKTSAETCTGWCVDYEIVATERNPKLIRDRWDAKLT